MHAYVLKSFMQVSYLQILNPCRFIYAIDWPPWFIFLTKLLNGIDLRIGDIFTLDCINSDFGFYEIFLIATLGPFLIMVANGLIYFVRICWSDSEMDSKAIGNSHIQFGFFTLFWIYSGVSSIITQTFVCRSPQ